MLYKGDTVQWIGETKYVGPQHDRRIAAKPGDYFTVTLFNPSLARKGIFLVKDGKTFGTVDPKDIKLTQRGRLYKLIHKE